jgi:hypothetical protein
MMSGFDMIPYEQRSPSNLGNGYYVRYSPVWRCRLSFLTVLQPYQQVQPEQAYVLQPPPHLTVNPLDNSFPAMMLGSRQQHHPLETPMMQSSSASINPLVQSRADTTPGSSRVKMEHLTPQSAVRYGMTPRTTPAFEPSGATQGHTRRESEQMGSQQASIGRGQPVQRPPNSVSQPGQAGGYAVQQVPRPTHQQSMGTNVQLPPMDLQQRHFPNCERALGFFQRVVWRPLHRGHGVPQTHDDRMPYVKRIYDALVDVGNVMDLEHFAIDAQKFTSNGIYGQSPKDIEAVAHRVVDVCVTLHTRGATGLTLRRLDLHTHDMEFTFAERIYFMAVLLRHFKLCADTVMMSSMTLQYLARIWSTLWERPKFVNWWGRISQAEKDEQINVMPYKGCTAQPPSAEESQQYVQLLQQDQAGQRMRYMAHQQVQPMAPQQQMQHTAEEQMRPGAHSQTSSLAQQQQVLAMFEQRTRQMQGSAVPKRPATALDFPEAGPSTKRRVTNASPALFVVQPQPNNPVMRGAVSNLLEFQFPAPPNDDGLTGGINFDEHFAPDSTRSGQENANGFLPSGSGGLNNALESGADLALVDYDSLFGGGEMAGEEGFRAHVLANLEVDTDDGLGFDLEAAGKDDEGSEYTDN